MIKLVSIMVPCYNCKKYISDCLEGIIALDYPRIEILIVDDASTDGTDVVIEEYKERLEKKAERLLFIKNTSNIGIGRNRNKMWKLAKGEYYKFIDADDYLMPDGVRKEVAYLEENPDCCIVHGNCVLIGKQDHFGGIVGEINVKNAPSGYYLTDALLRENFITASSVMISKDTRERYGYFIEKNMGEDWEYWLRVSVRGRIDYINHNICAYRVLESSASHYLQNEGKKRFYAMKELINIFEIYIKYASKETIRNFYNGQLINAFLCQNKTAVGMVKRKMNENRVNISLRTLIWIVTYKTGVYTIYKKIR